MSSGFNNLGFNYLLQGRYTDSISAFSRAIAIDPDNKRTHNNLGAAYALNGNEEKALQIFEKTIGKAAAYNNLGYIYMTQGEWDKAEKSFRHALELNPRFYTRAQENLDRLNRMRAKSRP
jgi:Flp pilus assembly protein TadD